MQIKREPRFENEPPSIRRVSATLKRQPRTIEHDPLSVRALVGYLYGECARRQGETIILEMARPSSVR
eukprot:7007375-Pyramimonas_sp.AAC.1